MDLRRNVQLTNDNGRTVQFNSRGTSTITVAELADTDSEPIRPLNGNDDNEELVDKIKELKAKYIELFGEPANAQEFFDIQKKGLEKLNKKLEEEIDDTSEGTIEDIFQQTKKDKLLNKKKRVQETLDFVKKVIFGGEFLTGNKSIFTLPPEEISSLAQKINIDQLKEKLPMLSETVLTSAATSFFTGGAGIFFSLAVNSFKVYSAYSLVEDLQEIKDSEQRELVETLHDAAEKLKNGDISQEEFKGRIKDIGENIQEEDECEGGCK